MSKLKLPDVTLVAIETREHELMRLAIADSLHDIEFADVLILTDLPSDFSQLDCQPRFHTVPDWPEKVGWARALWFEVPPLVATSHMLCIQWDSWVIDATKWTDEFLDYDYIGARWPFHENRRIGNSGFSLKSTQLARYIWQRRERFPCDTWVEDDLLCRKYRQTLEDAGFIWAPERLANEFAFECEEPRPAFGFHGCFNMGAVIGDRQKLLQRARLMFDSPNIGKQGNSFLKIFSERNPEVVKQLLGEQQKAMEN